MSKIEQLRQLESEQVNLLATMQKSDAHALKCTKLGLNFAETYPDDEAEYIAARETYNTNEVVIEELRLEIEEEEAEKGGDHEPMHENE